MRTLMIVGAAGLALMALAGCKEKAGSNSPTDALKNAAKDASNAVGDIAARAREEAVAAAQEAYDAAAGELQELAGKVEKSSAEAKPAMEKLVADIGAQLDEAKTKIEAMRPDDADWKQLSTEFASLMTKIGDGIKSLASQLK